MLKVELLHSTPLWVVSKAIRKCWASEGKSDTYKCISTGIHYGEDVHTGIRSEIGEKDKALIHKVGNKNKHSSVLRHLNYTFDISGISTKTLLAFTRHKAGVDFSVQSTRYTTKKRKDELGFTKSGDIRIDSKLHTIMELIQEAISEGVSNDDLSLLLPQAYQYSTIVTMNAQAIQHFLKLRTNPSAHYDIRNLAYAIYDNLPEEHKYLFKESIYKPTEDTRVNQVRKEILDIAKNHNEK